MFAAKVKSFAKLNLSLNIAGASGGYHLLDSVVTSIDIYDTVCAKPRDDRLINVYMHGMRGEEIPPEQNNAFRAAEAFVKEFSTPGADITVYKNSNQSMVYISPNFHSNTLTVYGPLIPYDHYGTRNNKIFKGRSIP